MCNVRIYQPPVLNYEYITFNRKTQNVNTVNARDRQQLHHSPDTFQIDQSTGRRRIKNIGSKPVKWQSSKLSVRIYKNEQYIFIFSRTERYFPHVFLLSNCSRSTNGRFSSYYFQCKRHNKASFVSFVLQF